MTTAVYVNASESTWTDLITTEVSYAIFPNFKTGHVKRWYLVGLSLIVDTTLLDETWGITVHFVGVTESEGIRRSIFESLRDAKNAVRVFWWNNAEEALGLGAGDLRRMRDPDDTRQWSARMHLCSLVRFYPLFHERHLTRTLVVRDADSLLTKTDVDLVKQWTVDCRKCLFYKWDSKSDPYACGSATNLDYPCVCPYAGASSFPRGFPGVSPRTLRTVLVIYMTTPTLKVRDEELMQRCLSIPIGDKDVYHQEPIWFRSDESYVLVRVEVVMDALSVRGRPALHPRTLPLITTSKYYLDTRRLTRPAFLRLP
jgi:hypothetical protein